MKVPCKSCGYVHNFNETGNLAGAGFTCSGCGKRGEVLPYCSQCFPVGVEEKDFLEFQSPFAGQTKCRSGRHTITIYVGNSAVHGALSGWGSEISQYHQGQHSKGLGKGYATKASGGYCAGLALDWIRRALLRGKLSYVDEDTTDISKQKKQDTRAAIAWDKKKSENWQPFINAHDERFQDWLRQKSDQIESNKQETVNKVMKLIQLLQEDKARPPSQRVKSEAEFNKIVARAREMLQEAKEKETQQKQVVKTAFDERMNRSSMEKFWSEFSRIMDGVIAQDRLDRGKSGQGSAGFAGLKVAKNSFSTDYRGVHNFIDTIMNDSELKANRAVYVGINPPTPGAVGHAVAILRQNTGDRYHMFDPNFGVYEMDYTGVRQAFIYLFKMAYPFFASANTSDNHPYEINGLVKGSYTIFEGSLPNPITVTRTVPTELKTQSRPQLKAPQPIKNQTTNNPQPKTNVNNTQQQPKQPTTSNTNTTNTGQKTRMQLLREKFGN